MASILYSLFSTDGFMPHGHCYLWTPSLVWTMVVTDSLIGLSYLFIASCLYSFVRRLNVPFSAMILAFGLFIAACGVTHFMEVFTLWIPSYWLAALAKVITAAASVATAVYMIPIRPRVAAMVNASRKAEEQQVELRKRDETLRIVVDGVRDYAIFMLDPQGRVSSWNEGAKRIKYYKSSEILGRHFSTFYPPEDLKNGKPERELEEAKRVGRFEDEGWRVRKDGSRFWADVVITAVRDDQGTLLGFSKVTRDITERKNAEEALRHSYENLEKRVQERTAELAQWESVFSRAGWGVTIASADNKLIKVNPMFAQMHGTTSEEWIGRSLLDMFADESKSFLDKWIQAAYEVGHTSYESIHVRKDGSKFPVLAEVTAVKDDQGRLLYRVSNYQDVTETKKAEQQLKDSEERFRQFAESIPQLAWVARADGYIYWYNQNWYRYTGATFKDLEGWGWQRVHCPETLPRVMKKWKESLDTGQSFAMEFPLKGGDGHFRWFLTRISPLRNEKGEVIQWFGTNTDIDDQKHIAEERERALNEAKEAIQARDEFLSIASHELKTPLTSISLQLQLLDRTIWKNVQENIPIGPDENVAQVSGITLAKLAQQIRASGEQTQRLGHLLDELLDFTRVRLGRLILSPEKINLSEVIADVVERSNADFHLRGVDVAVDVDPSIEGNWDRMRMEQVVTNLLSNAFKYGKGKPIEVSLRREGGKVLLKISDHGIGIAPEMRRKIFERFERVVKGTEISGFGLGLYITRQIVEAHGGMIRVDSELGKGSTFTVEIPFADSIDVGLNNSREQEVECQRLAKKQA